MKPPKKDVAVVSRRKKNLPRSQADHPMTKKDDKPIRERGRIRGITRARYLALFRMVQNKEITWDELEQRGIVLPIGSDFVQRVRETTKLDRRGRRLGIPPKTYTRKELATSIEMIRELLMGISAIVVRMKERKIEALTISGGMGSEAYQRAESAIKTWEKALRSAFLDEVKKADVDIEIKEESSV